MVYREMEHLGISPSLLGFGCMRFPTLADGSIDEEQSENMIDRAMEAGVTYIDTAYPYHEGKSEPFVGKVLKKHKRDSYYLATKLPMWAVHSIEDANRIFAEQLERLSVDYVDFYLLHALDKNRFETVLNLDLLSWCEEMRKQGKIKYIGFSFHDDFETFEKIINYRKWDFCQIQLNYMDTDVQAGIKGYEMADKLGIPVVLMEPIKGGMLASLPEEIDALFKKENPHVSTASWALRWAGSLSNVKVILSGMSSYQQVEDNLKTFSDFKELSDTEQEVVKNVSEQIKSRVKNGCTACRYCMPCPYGVDIPRNFGIWNTYAMYEEKDRAKRAYFDEMQEGNRALQCKKCGKCEPVCPQGIAIRKDLEKIAEEFSQF